MTLPSAATTLLAASLLVAGCPAIFDRSGIPCDAYPGACGWDAAGPADAGVPDAPVDAVPVPDAIPDAEWPDAAPPPVEDVAHVPEDGWKGGEADLVLAGNCRINTGNFTIKELNDAGMPTGDVSLPAGAFTTSPQVGTDVPELAVLRVRDFQVEQGADVRVIGSRPLVVIAASKARIDGVLDAVGRTVTGTGGKPASEPGAGGHPSLEGPGGGELDPNQGNAYDSGGGGAGHATAGAPGGQACADSNCDTKDSGGAAGPAYGAATVPVLQGGSGGGQGTTGGCIIKGGAGGGALQIYAAVSLTVNAGGGINTGGGGGAGGAVCFGNPGSGAGGGSGGVIYLQSRNIIQDGTLAANGGGGGGSAGKTGSTTYAGVNGDDGRIDTMSAQGGAGGGSQLSAKGGNGGAADQPPGDGGALSVGDSNGGGGGGAVGYIVLHTDNLTSTGITSPLHKQIPQPYTGQ